MIPRAPTVEKTTSQTKCQNNKNTMLDKLKLFKNQEKSIPVSNSKGTSSSSGISSARSDSSASIDTNIDRKPVRNMTRVKQARSSRTQQTKNIPNATKEEILGFKSNMTALEVEKHAHKVANLPVTKLAEPKVRVIVKKSNHPIQHNSPQHHMPQSVPSTGIPKPSAAIKGTSKVTRDVRTSPFNNTGLSRENSQDVLMPHKPAVALVSPMKNNDKKHNNISECHRPNPVTNKTENVPDRNKILKRTEPISHINKTQALPPPQPLDSRDEVNTERNIMSNFDKGTKNISSSKEIIDVQRKFRNHNEDREGCKPSAVEPMRPLMAGFSSTLTLPQRRKVCQKTQDDKSDDYCEINLANGYLSDGEMLRNLPLMNFDGYMSEGGAVLNARRLQIMPPHLPNGSSRLNSGLTVLTEQVTRRGGSRDSPPPPPAPRATSKSNRNGVTLPEKHTVQQWKRYNDSPGVGSPPAAGAQQQQQPPPGPTASSPTAGRREGGRKESPAAASNKEKGNSRGGVRGVPQNFGYVKRSGNNGTTGGGGGAVNGTMGNGPVNGDSMQATAIHNQSSKATTAAVPRTKVKVSGGTQTCSSDLQPIHKPNQPQFKSFSLTGNTANQLSQSVRERLMMGSQSLPKGAMAHLDYGLVLRQGRSKVSDGSLSDTQAIENSSPYNPWLRHSNTYSVAPRLCETDSMESLTSLPGHRSSLTHTRLLRDSPSRLSRSNSIRSTKSEKLYPSMLHRNAEPETEPYYCLPVGTPNNWSQPTSPAPGGARTFPLSPTHSNTLRHSIPKNDEIHGSSISLVSTASSLYSSAEEKQAHEIRKLRRELGEAQEKVHTLTSQLSTNAHVVSAFEQSLTSMTQRLQHLTATSEKKEAELQELRQAMDALRVQSLQAGIGTGLARQPSSDSVSSLSSACSLDKHDKKKKKGWLRSSFSKAFSRNAKVTRVQLSENEPDQLLHSSSVLSAPTDAGQEVAELQKQLREKDLVLTDIRLEALSSAHQLESLKDTVMKMRSEMLSLKQNNERLQRMVSGSTNQALEINETRSNSMDMLSDLVPTEEPIHEHENDGKRITISVYLGQPQTFEKYYAEHYGFDGKCDNANTEISIAHTNIGASTSWAHLDNAVRKAFKQYVARLDPGGGLGLGSDSIASYKLGEAERKPETCHPDLLPVGYTIGRVFTLHVVLQPIAALAFEALIPKGVAQRLVSLLAEHRRLVLCGAPGTGKTHLAIRLAEFHAQSLERDPAEAVATFNVDNKSNKELRQYLAHLSEQATAGDDNNVLPCVVVLDNLHKAGSLADALGSLPRNLPCLLGTMAQSACSATSLQLQHGFRWVLVAPHMEPARGLLGRVLRRRLAALELEQGPQPELAAILGWLPRVWQHLNAFLETHSSGDVAIGPRLFLSCPLELDAARAWFADVWNYSLAPYLREAAREGLQLYGRRATWTDPTQFILDTYPWPGALPQGLTTISAKDVGIEPASAVRDESEGDPLLNMLMQLQEAANYSSPHSNSSEYNSLESNIHDSNLGTETVP